MSDCIYKNKYQKCYHMIIDKAKMEPRSKKDQYYEKHHIKPKSMNGDDSNENKILLTAREHFICHKLLTKFTYGVDKMKMCCSLWRMCNKQGNKEYHTITSRTYELARKEFSEERSKHYRHSDETKRKIGKSCSGEKNGMYGRHRTEAEIQKYIKCNSIGIFKTPWGDYLTANQASKHAPIKISYVSIWNLCHHRNEKPFESIRPQMKYLGAVKGQTPFELGFEFIPDN